MPSSKRHMITAALPYANGPLHLGHLAGVYISADIYARFLRSNNEDVAFICGSGYTFPSSRGTLNLGNAIAHHKRLLNDYI